MLHLFTLTWNGLPMLSELHASLMPALNGVDYIWHIKDNGSNDGTVAAVQSWNNPSIKVYAYPDNKLSFAEGMNWLYQESNAAPDDHIMLLNNDVVIRDTNSIKNMIASLTDEVGVVGARLLFTNTNKVQHGGVVFSANHGRMPIHHRANDVDDADARANRYFQAVTGAVLLTKASYYATVCTTNKSGRLGMDEGYKWAFEDIDLCLAIAHKLGKKIVYCGATDIFHGESVSLKKNPVNKLFMSPNVNLFRQKWSDSYVIDAHVYINNRDYGLIKKS